MPSEVLLSRQVTLTVPSPLEGLTTVFGMGTGVTLPLISPGKLIKLYRVAEGLWQATILQRHDQ